IVTLERLLAHFIHTLEEPLKADVDTFQLGRWFLNTGFPIGIKVLERSYAAGSRRAGHLLGTSWRRSGKLHRSERIWLEMYENLGDRFAAFELAKHFEHRRKDFAMAESLVKFLLSTEIDSYEYAPRIENTESLIHRLERIRKKASLTGRRPKKP
ncbi:MAG: hypothetical protein HN368_00110, partial [Spirochaetales bacterium]|nr:hypothetical protein [Spirochaetales bacterium]